MSHATFSTSTGNRGNAHHTSYLKQCFPKQNHYPHIGIFPLPHPEPDTQSYPEKKYSMIDMNYDGFIYLLGLLLADVLPAEKIVHFCQVVGVLGDSVSGTGRSVVTLSVNNMTEVAHLQAVSTRVYQVGKG